MKQFSSRIRNNKTVADGYNSLEFEWPSDAGAPLPGQFVTIRNGETTDPLLRRPFAVAAFTSGVCQIIYQIRGKGTEALAARREGDLIDVLGPLGNGFPSPQPDRTSYLLAGGIGFGPIYYLANTLLKTGSEHIAIIGARKASIIPDVVYNSRHDGTELFQFCTDDGSRGFHGTVIEMLRSSAGLSSSSAEIFACGPNAMLTACAKLAKEADIRCWVSMEQVMGCGVGACMGCAIRSVDTGKYVRVCTEGPVFNTRDLQW